MVTLLQMMEKANCILCSEGTHHTYGAYNISTVESLTHWYSGLSFLSSYRPDPRRPGGADFYYTNCTDTPCVQAIAKFMNKYRRNPEMEGYD